MKTILFADIMTNMKFVKILCQNIKKKEKMFRKKNQKKNQKIQLQTTQICHSFN